MKRIKWKEKITRKKVLCAIVAAILATAVSFGLSEVAAELISKAITATIAIIAYFVGDTCTEGDKNDDIH